MINKHIGEKIVNCTDDFMHRGRDSETISSRGDKGAATKKLPTPKFKFLLGFRPPNLANAHAKQNRNF